MKIKILVLFVLSFVIVSCKKEFKSELEFSQWLNDPDNGLKRSQNSGGLSFVLTYLPKPYLAKKEIKNSKADLTETKKIMNSYANSLSFLLTIKPDSTDSEVDIMKTGVKNYDEYKQRFLAMNFELGESIKLKIGNNELAPTLFNVENTYGLANDININIVFDNKQIQQIPGEKIELVFMDDYFETGIHHFVFQKNKLFDLPEFNY